MKLEFGLIPQTSWGLSLANKLGKEEWDKIRKEVYKKANYRCQICGEDGVLHSHEVWRFELKKKIQRLVGIECLCEMCHNVKHFGRSKKVYSKSYVDRLIKHWCKINGKSERDFNAYNAKVHLEYKKLAGVDWQVKVGRKVIV